MLMSIPFSTTWILAFGLPGHSEWLILLVIGLLIFGRRLPEVGRNIGRSIVEFKRGIKGIGDEIEEESSHDAPRSEPKRIAENATGQGFPTDGETAQKKSETVPAANAEH